jgi:hypothetical protein
LQAGGELGFSGSISRQPDTSHMAAISRPALREAMSSRKARRSRSAIVTTRCRVFPHNLPLSASRYIDEMAASSSTALTA